MRRVLLLGALPLSTAFGGVALAQTTVSDTRTEPLTTSVDGDITVDENGEINLQDQGLVAINIDSDNNVDMEGLIDVSGNEDSLSAILITGARTSNIDVSGSILVDSDAVVLDEVPDDYPQGRFGILLAQGGQLTGDITFDDTAVVGIESDFGAVVGLQGTLDGNLTVNGDLLILGDDSAVVETQDVTGDILIESNTVIGAEGIRTDGVVVNGNVGGAFQHNGLLNVTGFTDLLPENTGSETDNDDFQEQRPSGNGIQIFGDVNGGVLINGIVPSDDDNDDNGDNDDDTEPDPGQGFSATVQVSGGGVALTVEGEAGSPLQIGAITNEADLRDDYGSWSIENRGIVSSTAIYDGFSAQSVVLRDANLVGGFRNSGSITATSSTEFATAVGIYSTQVPELLTVNNISATVSEGTGTATAVYVDNFSSLPALTNERTIAARSDLGSSFGILDESGSLTSITNTGAISAQSSLDDDAPGEFQFAVDVRNNTTGVVFNNTIPADQIDEDGSLLSARSGFGIVVGNVAFGSGNDQLLFDAGFLTGDVEFGAGDDFFSISEGTAVVGDINFGSGFNRLVGDNALISGTLDFGTGTGNVNLSNASEYIGTLSNMDGVDFTLNASTATLSDETNTSISSVSVENGSDLFFSVNNDGTSISTLNVAGAFSVDESSSVDILFSGFIDEEFQATLVSAGQLNVSLDSLNADLTENGSFVVDEQLTIDENNPNDLVLTLTLRTAEELGINESVASIYQPTLTTLQDDNDLSAAFLNLSSEEEFDAAFEQFLPASLDMSLRAAELQSNAISSLTSTRSNLLLRNEQTSDGVVWGQQQFSIVDRDNTGDVQAYRGQSYTLAVGIDKPLLGLDVLGASVAISSSSLDEFEQEDLPNTRVVWDFGAYAAKWLGPLALDGRFGYGMVQNSSDRRLVIDDERREFSANWEGTQLSGFARAQIPLSVGRFGLIPSTSLDWVSLTDDEYTEFVENSDVTSLAIVADEREASSMYLNTGLTLDFRGNTRRGGAAPRGRPNRPFGAPRVGGGGTGGFAISAGYSHPLNDDQLTASYAYQGGESFELVSDPLEGRIYGGADFNYNDDIFVFSAGVYTQFDDVSQAISGRVSLGVRW